MRLDELDVELGTDGPPGLERPAAVPLFSAPGALRLPSRSGGVKMETGYTFQAKQASRVCMQVFQQIHQMAMQRHL